MSKIPSIITFWGVLTEHDSAAAYSRFLAEFWALARSRQQIKAIREIDEMISAIARPRGIEGRSQMAEPFDILNVDCSGNVSTFSPELMDVKNETLGISFLETSTAIG